MRARVEKVDVLGWNKSIGGAFECLIGYLKDYTVWHPRQTKASYGIKNQIRDGFKTVMGLIKKLHNTVTKYSELKDLSSSLATDAHSSIVKILEFVTIHYEDLVDNSTMRDSESWELVVDCVSQIFE